MAFPDIQAAMQRLNGYGAMTGGGAMPQPMIPGNFPNIGAAMQQLGAYGQQANGGPMLGNPAPQQMMAGFPDVAAALQKAQELAKLRAAGIGGPQSPVPGAASQINAIPTVQNYLAGVGNMAQPGMNTAAPAMTPSGAPTQPAQQPVLGSATGGVAGAVPQPPPSGWRQTAPDEYVMDQPAMPAAAGPAGPAQPQPQTFPGRERADAMAKALRAQSEGFAGVSPPPAVTGAIGGYQRTDPYNPNRRTADQDPRDYLPGGRMDQLKQAAGNKSGGPMGGMSSPVKSSPWAYAQGGAPVQQPLMPGGQFTPEGKNDPRLVSAFGGQMMPEVMPKPGVVEASGLDPQTWNQMAGQSVVNRGMSERDINLNTMAARAAAQRMKLAQETAAIAAANRSTQAQASTYRPNIGAATAPRMPTLGGNASPYMSGYRSPAGSFSTFKR